MSVLTLEPVTFNWFDGNELKLGREGSRGIEWVLESIGFHLAAGILAGILLRDSLGKGERWGGGGWGVVGCLLKMP